MQKLNPILKSSSVIKKFENNPILSAKDIGYDASLIFNAGVTKYNGKYVMLFRNDYGTTESEYHIKSFAGTNIGMAFSDDGIHWKAEKEPFIKYEDINNDEISRFYDPRLTLIDNELYMCFAVDTAHGIRGGIGKIHNLKELMM